VADRETRRLSFGSVATDYDRYRPPPPSQALDWLIPPGAEVILDLAAGTGVVTRELIGRAARVVAVEPDERMRAVLAARCPEAEVLAGRGEDIPLPAASVDAVVVSAAWHWLDPGRAVPEITRVLRPGGRLGVMWVSRDDRVPWVAEFNAFARESREADRAEDQLVGLLGTYSGIITLEAGPRAEFSRRVTAFLDRQPWERVDLPLICRCLRSMRLSG